MSVRPKVGVIAAFTFREAVRKRIVLAAGALTILLLVLFLVGTHYAVQELERSPRILPTLRPLILAQLLLMGVWTISFLSCALTIFISVGTIAGEVEAGTLQVIVPKPLGRWEIVLGKWIGLAVMLGVYTALTVTAMLLIVYLRAGYLPPQPALGVALMVFQVLLLLSLSVLGSALLPPIASGIVIFMLYGLAVAGGMVEQIGNLIPNESLKLVGLISGVILPSDVLWRLASSYLQPRLLTPLQAFGPFSGILPASEWMAAYAFLYLLATVLAACIVFDRKDL